MTLNAPEICLKSVNCDIFSTLFICLLLLISVGYLEFVAAAAAAYDVKFCELLFDYDYCWWCFFAGLFSALFYWAVNVKVTGVVFLTGELDGCLYFGDLVLL